jgi:hypothetical protein
MQLVLLICTIVATMRIEVLADDLTFLVQLPDGKID